MRVLRGYVQAVGDWAELMLEGISPASLIRTPRLGKVDFQPWTAGFAAFGFNLKISSQRRPQRPGEGWQL